jgi:hypothetical protein
MDARARGNAETRHFSRRKVLAGYPRIRQCVEKVDVTPRLTFNPVDECRAVIVDEMRNRATSERLEIGARQRADDVTRKIESLRGRQAADDLTKPSPGQVRIRSRLADV